MQVLIIGGGVVGCALAREVARRGVRVTLLEAREEVGQEASGAAAGTLSYSPSAAMPPGWHALAVESLAAHRVLAAELAREVTEPSRWHWPGRLNVATTNDAERNARARLHADLAAGEAGAWLDKRALHVREPALGPRVQGGSFREGQGWVDAAHLTHALAEAARGYGAALHTDAHVTGLLWERARVVGVNTTEEAYRADAVIVAAGAWSGGLDPRVPVPIEPVRGQALRIQRHLTEPPLLSHLVSGNGIYLVPDGAGVTVGATHERVGFGRGNSVGGVSTLLARAIELLPALAEAPWEAMQPWSGFRPATPDRVPLLGPDPRASGLWWATGHFRSGVLLAPRTATLLTRALLDGEPLDAKWGVRTMDTV